MSPSEVLQEWWRALPWSTHTNPQLAEMTGRCVRNVRRWRRRVGEPYGGGHRVARSTFEPSPTTERDVSGPATQRSSRPAKAVVTNGEGELVDELVRFCRQKPRTAEEVCDHLDIGPARARALVVEARDMGCPLELHGERIAWHLPEEYRGPVARVDVAPAVGAWHSFAVVGDIHFGSKYCRDDFLVDFFEQAYGRGCRTFLQLGDITDGEYRHGIRELRAHGMDEQQDECIERLPRRDGVQWYFIDGNHDETFTNSAGAVAGTSLVNRARARGRHDMTFLGQRLGRIELDTGASYAPRIDLWHPKQGASYALSYRLQKKIENYAPGDKPDFLLCGHLHTFCRILSRGVHGVICGTFQGGGSAFSNSLPGGVALGGLIVNYTLTASGTLRNVAMEWVSYYENEVFTRVAL